MVSNTNNSDVDVYHIFTAFDDIAFSALKVSLSEPERSLILERLRQDWMTDVGVIGVPRQQQIQTKSAEAAARVYWGSRREPLSPRVESLLASFLINLASALAYDVLKEFSNVGYDVSKLLEGRGVNISAVTGFVGEISILLEHVRAFMRLYRAKQDTARSEEIRNAVQAVLDGQMLEIQDRSADVAVDLLMENLVPAVRGVIVEELKKKNVFVDTKADGVLTQGMPASVGFGFGPPVRWKGQRIDLTGRSYVLLVADSDIAHDIEPRPPLEEAAAIISWGGGMTSHVAVVSRALGRPAVIISASEVDMLMRRKFLLVDGSKGEVRSFHKRPDTIDGIKQAPRKNRKRQVYQAAQRRSPKS
jgi:phosphohistidine swiveling domain-containing protein